MNGLYVVTRLIKYPDMFVAKDDEAAIKESNYCGAVELFCLGKTDMPEGYLWPCNEFMDKGRFRLVHRWKREYEK